MYKIALATQSLWDRSLEQAIEVAAAVGYDGVEIVCHPPFLPFDQLRCLSDSIPRRLESLRLGVASLTVVTDFVTSGTMRENVRFLNAIAELAGAYGTDLVKMSPGPPAAADASPEQWGSAISLISECADHARDLGVCLAIETHLGQLSNTTAGTLRLIRGIDRPNVGVVLDWCNLMVGGDDPVEATGLLAEHIRLIHAKDAHMTDDGPRWDPIAQGTLDYPGLVSALRATQFSGYISVESLLRGPRYDFTGRPTDPEVIVAGELASLRRLTSAAGS